MVLTKRFQLRWLRWYSKAGIPEVHYSKGPVPNTNSSAQQTFGTAGQYPVIIMSLYNLLIWLVAVQSLLSLFAFFKLQCAVEFSTKLIISVCGCLDSNIDF